MTVNFRGFNHRGIVAAVAAVVCTASPGTADAQMAYNTVALSGPTGTAMGFGPNLGAGVNFLGLGRPVLNAGGTVAFGATLTGPGLDNTNNRGIWTSAGGTLTPVAGASSAGSGPNVGAGVNFSLFEEIVLSPGGAVAFLGRLAGPGVNIGTNDTGVWSNAGGTLRAVARAGTEGPGPNIGAGVGFTGFYGIYGVSTVLNAGGAVAFGASVVGSNVGSTNDRGIRTNAGGTLSVVAREGAAGPGPNVGAGVHFSELLSSLPVIYASGTVGFSAESLAIDRMGGQPRPTATIQSQGTLRASGCLTTRVG